LGGVTPRQALANLVRELMRQVFRLHGFGASGRYVFLELDRHCGRASLGADDKDRVDVCRIEVLNTRLHIRQD